MVVVKEKENIMSVKQLLVKMVLPQKVAQVVIFQKQIKVGKVIILMVEKEEMVVILEKVVEKVKKVVEEEENGNGDLYFIKVEKVELLEQR